MVSQSPPPPATTSTDHNDVAYHIGTPSFLSHPDVQEAPPRINHPVPVPSVYQDGRGAIHNFAIGGFRVNILSSKAGVMRSGDIHDSTQRDFVFAGKVQVWILVEHSNKNNKNNKNKSKKQPTQETDTTATKDDKSQEEECHEEDTDTRNTQDTTGSDPSASRKGTTDDDNFTTVRTIYGPGSYITIPPYTPHIFEFLEDSVMAEWWDGPFHAWFYTPYRQLVQQSLVNTQGRPGVFHHYHVMNEAQEQYNNNSTAPTGSSSWNHLMLVAGLGICVGYLLGRRRGSSSNR